MCNINDEGGGHPPPLFTDVLGIRVGDVVSLIGCGGKTSLMNRLTAENRGRVVLMTTTTKIRRPCGELVDHLPRSPAELRPGVNLVFGGEEKGKLVGLPLAQLAAWLPPAEIAFVEADGSKGLPLKGWADHEPVIPDRTTITIGVCTVWPVGRRCGPELAHRMEAFHRLTGASPGDSVTLEHIAAMVGQPEGMFGKAAGRKVLLINQVENPADGELARQLWEKLKKYDRGNKIQCFCGSVRQGTIYRIEEIHEHFAK